MDCIFCKILKKEIPSIKIYEDDFSYCFKDINPQASIHYVLIPKKHMEDISKVDDETLLNIFSAIKNIAKKENILSYRLVTNKGKEAGQSVFHMHFHIISDKKLSDKMA